MEAVEVLRKARALISDPARWTRGNYASGPDGKPRRPLDRDAVQWCALGAIGRVAYSSRCGELAMVALRDTTVRAANVGAATYNDRKGHAAVLAAFDETIARLEAEELESIPVAEPERPEVLTPA